MSRIRRRKGNRLATTVGIPIVVFAADKRIEGQLLDHSESGVGALLPLNSGIAESQTVRILLKRERKVAKVIRVSQTEDGDRIGLKLN